MIDYSGYKYLKIEKEGNVAIVTLNRPEVLNAVNPEMHEELAHIFGDLNEDSEVRAVVLTGAGKAFCAGGDVKSMAAGTTVPSIFLAGGTLGGTHARKLLDSILNLRMPLISAVNGAAAGLGSTLALFADIVIVGESAKIGDTHVRVGLVAGDGGAVIFPLLVGVAKAKELLMTGDIISAREAERIGLVNMVVPDAELLPKAKAFANRLAAGSPLAIGWTKAAINKRIKQDIEAIFDTSNALEALSFFSEDHKEASKAFTEKRQPKFKGK